MNTNASTLESTKTTKSKMYRWSDFKPEYMNSVDKIKLCIEDIKQYKDKQKEYEILDYDLVYWLNIEII